MASAGMLMPTPAPGAGIPEFVPGCAFATAVGFSTSSLYCETSSRATARLANDISQRLGYAAYHTDGTYQTPPEKSFS